MRSSHTWISFHFARAALADGANFIREGETLMNRAIALATILASAAVAGCASTETDVAQYQRSNDPRAVCDQERPIGSNIAIVKCRTPEQIEQERSAAQDALATPSRGANPTPYKAGS